MVPALAVSYDIIGAFICIRFNVIISAVITHIEKDIIMGMYQPTDKAPGMEQVIKDISGVDRVAIINNDHCATCDNPNLAFRDTLSQKEYRISGMCQDCQDQVFGKEET